MATKDIKFPEATPAKIEDVATPQKPAPIELDVPRDATLVRDATEDRIAVLKALAKKNEDEGYPREARIIGGDAARLEDLVLPQVTAQSEIPLATADEVSAAVCNELRALVRKHAKEASDKIDHEAVLLEQLGGRIAKFVSEVAERAWLAGYAVRHQTPELLALSQAAVLGRPVSKGSVE